MSSNDVFEDQIFPVLTPLAVDPAHPFPYISDLSLNLAVVVRDPGSAVRRFARVKVPPLLPRFLKLSGGRRFVPIEQVIAAHLERLFPGMTIVEHHAFRVTRDADVEVEVDEADDLLAHPGVAAAGPAARARGGPARGRELDVAAGSVRYSFASST